MFWIDLTHIVSNSALLMILKEKRCKIIFPMHQLLGVLYIHAQTCTRPHIAFIIIVEVMGKYLSDICECSTGR